ncbi:uncharacterized protein [Medicago truncatula]|uniref:Pectinesterase inhibitor domain-containing protein n=1 Tax=Medicago truncatula TaxID=3880 RepID=A0A072VUL0_MEDTR|nr:uncharacterized protein LOC120575979 [Medicago truncatula]KEH41785.1 hypothetical protein MTR_1g054740 [Medicago truncatula]
MASSTYLSILLTISMIFISHANSPTPSLKLYQNVCKQPGQKDFEQRCLKLIEGYPPITLIKDYLTFCRSFLKIAAIGKAIKSQQQVKEIMKKYPSSQPIKECANDYNSVVGQLKVALIEEPDLIDLDIRYASDALGRCEDSLAREKNVNTSAIATLNHEMQLYNDIVLIAAGHL